MIPLAPKIKLVLKYLLFLSIGLGLLYLAFKNTDPHQMLRDLKNADYKWIILSLLVSVIGCIIRAHRWNMLIHPLGFRPKLKNTYAALMAGYLANLAVPRIGEVTRCESLTRTEKIPFNILLGTVISERIVDLIMLCLMLLLTAILKIHVLGKFILIKVIYPLKDKVYLALHSTLFIGGVLAFGAGLIVLLVYFWKRQPTSGSSKIKNLLKGVKEGVKSIRKIKSVSWFVFHTLMIWIVYFLTSYLCFFALPATSGLGIIAGIFCVSIGGIGMSAPVQGGIGAYHIMISVGLTLFAIPFRDGNTYATIVHTSQTLLVLVTGALSIVYLFISNRKSINDGPATPSK